MSGGDEPYGDLVAIKNLQLPFAVHAPNVWGIVKEQPALVTVTLALRRGFTSAASNDALDHNTIHYGELAKRIRAGCTAGQTIASLCSSIEHVIHDMGLRPDGTTRVSRAVLQIDLPKASMFGNGLYLMRVVIYEGDGLYRSELPLLGISDVKIETLIGVNEYERKGKQPVVASLELYLGGDLLAGESQMGEAYETAMFFQAEHKLVQIVQNTSFETLESLADFTVKQLVDDLLEEKISCNLIKLRLEKPRAIAFADGSSVEVLRRVPKVEPDAVTA